MGIHITSAQISSVKGGLLIRDFNSGWEDLSITLPLFRSFASRQDCSPIRESPLQMPTGNAASLQWFLCVLKNKRTKKPVQHTYDASANYSWSWSERYSDLKPVYLSSLSLSVLVRVLSYWLGVIGWLEMNFILRNWEAHVLISY